MEYGIEAIRIFLQYGFPILMVGGSWGLSVLFLRSVKQLQGRVVRAEQE